MSRNILVSASVGLMALYACAPGPAQDATTQAASGSLISTKVSISPKLVLPALPAIPISSATATTSGSISAPSCNPQTFAWSGPLGMTSCPHIPASATGAFKSEPVFEGGTLVELARHCTFTWTASTPGAPPDLQELKSALSSYGKLAAPAPDCPVVEPQADIDPFLTQAFEDQLMQQTSPVPRGLPQASRVRVAILDTAAVPYMGESSDNYGHGRSMGRIVHRLACSQDDKSCPVEIDNQLALAYLKVDQRDDERGGFFGTRVDLARAIHRELQAWGKAALADGGAAPPLVINLSVGWDSLHGGSAATLTNPSRMVYLALERASCLGAAIIVAAGNASGDSRSGLMLPALWQDRIAPDQARCGKITGLPFDMPGLLRPRTAPAGASRLLEAAAAVDVYDQPLSNARSAATPRFVAYGQSATTSDPRTDYTDVLSGSSVAAAVLSAAVASVWSVLPGESPYLVLKHVYESAVPLSRSVEPCLSSACAQVHRVAVCEASRSAACAGPGCAELEKCQTMPAGEGHTTLEDFPFFSADYPVLASHACPAEGCASSGPGYSYAPWVGPQPGPQTCPYCFINLYFGRGLFTLSPTLQRASSMELQLDNGNRYQVARDGATTLPESFSVNGLDTRAARSARLISVIGDGREARVTETPLLVF